MCLLSIPAPNVDSDTANFKILHIWDYPRGMHHDHHTSWSHCIYCIHFMFFIHKGSSQKALIPLQNNTSVYCIHRGFLSLFDVTRELSCSCEGQLLSAYLGRSNPSGKEYMYTECLDLIWPFLLLPVLLRPFSGCFPGLLEIFTCYLTLMEVDGNVINVQWSQIISVFTGYSNSLCYKPLVVPPGAST